MINIRIARELHDDLSRQSAALSIGMGILKRQIPPQQPGRGIRPSGLGMVSIKKRALLVNGACKVQSRPNQGATVLVTIPSP